ncbi:hypothetical protein LZ30DRAFT_721887 [Colletotrichum cereale]|nr:hypothetical protein LZ30DRAFT_721887 [Colletotrichum cereale]
MPYSDLIRGTAIFSPNGHGLCLSFSQTITAHANPQPRNHSYRSRPTSITPPSHVQRAACRSFSPHPRESLQTVRLGPCPRTSAIPRAPGNRGAPSAIHNRGRLPQPRGGAASPTGVGQVPSIHPFSHTRQSTWQSLFWPSVFSTFPPMCALESIVARLTASVPCSLLSHVVFISLGLFPQFILAQDQNERRERGMTRSGP